MAGDLEQQFASQGISIGVQTGGWQSDQDISSFDFLSGEQLSFLNSAHNKARKVVLPGVIHARHLRRFAPDQRATIVPAATGNAFHHISGNRSFQSSYS